MEKISLKGSFGEKAFVLDGLFFQIGKPNPGTPKIKKRR